MDNTQDALDIVGISIVSELKKLAKKDKFEASGNLDRSFTYEKKNNTVLIYGAKYTMALSDGIKNRNKSNSKTKFDKKLSNIREWANTKGITPRDAQGRLLPRTDRNMRNMAYFISRSIKEKGISKRFGYKGSGFFEKMTENTIIKVSDIISEAYKKDIIVKIQ